MPKFLFIYLDPVEQTVPEFSPEEMQTNMEKWFQWLGAGKESGWVVEMGEALKPDVKVVAADHSVVDGPHPESKELIGGYSLIQADNHAAACELAKGCPIFESGGSVEVREINEFPDPSSM